MGTVTLVDESSHRFVAKGLDGPLLPLRSKQGHLNGTKTPICMACKDKNYTRHHCREKHRHLQVPWQTVYVCLSAIPFDGPEKKGYFADQIRTTTTPTTSRPPSSSIVTPTPSVASTHHDDGKDRCILGKRSFDSSISSCLSLKKQKSNDSSSLVDVEPTASLDQEEEEVSDLSDDLFKVESSKTFLLTINQDCCVFRWLEVDPDIPICDFQASMGYPIEDIYPDHTQCYPADNYYESTPPYTTSSSYGAPGGYSQGYDMQGPAGSSHYSNEYHYSPSPEWTNSSSIPPMPVNSKSNWPHSSKGGDGGHHGYQEPPAHSSYSHPSYGPPSSSGGCGSFDGYGNYNDNRVGCMMSKSSNDIGPQQNQLIQSFSLSSSGSFENNDRISRSHSRVQSPAPAANQHDFYTPPIDNMSHSDMPQYRGPNNKNGSMNGNTMPRPTSMQDGPPPLHPSGNNMGRNNNSMPNSSSYNPSNSNHGNYHSHPPPSQGNGYQGATNEANLNSTALPSQNEYSNYRPNPNPNFGGDVGAVGGPETFQSFPIPPNTTENHTNHSNDNMYGPPKGSHDSMMRGGERGGQYDGNMYDTSSSYGNHGSAGDWNGPTIGRGVENSTGMNHQVSSVPTQHQRMISTAPMPNNGHHSH